MQITYRIPSKKVPYGFIEFQWERTDGDASLPDAGELAEEYAQYIKDYQAAEVQAFENPSARQIRKADKPKEDINDLAGDDVEKAASIVKEELGAAEVGEHEPVAPWDKKEETETPKSKPVWDF